MQFPKCVRNLPKLSLLSEALSEVCPRKLYRAYGGSDNTPIPGFLLPMSTKGVPNPTLTRPQSRLSRAVLHLKEYLTFHSSIHSQRARKTLSLAKISFQGIMQWIEPHTYLLLGPSLLFSGQPNILLRDGSPWPFFLTFSEEPRRPRRGVWYCGRFSNRTLLNGTDQQKPCQVGQHKGSVLH